MSQSIVDILQAAVKAYPDKTAIVDPQKNVLYAELEQAGISDRSIF